MFVPEPQRHLRLDTKQSVRVRQYPHRVVRGASAATLRLVGSGVNLRGVVDR